MASRKEQKEQLRREREQREAEAKAATRRKQMIGYAAGGLAVVVIVIVAVVVLTGGDGGSGGKSGDSSNVLPDGGSVPERKIVDLAPAAKAAGCTLRSFKSRAREHTDNLDEKIKYDTTPPAAGRHFATPAEDGAYDQPPDAKELVHTMEHGRMVIWFKKDAPEKTRADLKALFDEDSYQMVLTPDPTGMKYQVAATAWSREPTPDGTGRLLGCQEFDDKTMDALQAFRDEYRGNGPEAVP